MQGSDNGWDSKTGSGLSMGAGRSSTLITRLEKSLYSFVVLVKVLFSVLSGAIHDLSASKLFLVSMHYIIGVCPDEEIMIRVPREAD